MLKVRGRISGAYGVENMDRVRKSSDGRLGAVKLANDFAAKRKAWKEAVRFEANVDRVRLGLQRARLAPKATTA